MKNIILIGDVLQKLKEIPDQVVNTCVTSPPYWVLRDYNLPPIEWPDGWVGCLGLEPTPEMYVSHIVMVFREVRRVLRDDGTLWLNLGDSYAVNGKNRTELQATAKSTIQGSLGGQQSILKQQTKIVAGLKPKDLVGIPWAVAEALRDPYYTGSIKNEKDRTWIAAMIDGEGTICGFNHIRKDDGRQRTGININITNSSIPLLDEAYRIWPTSRKEHNLHGEGHLGSLPTYRWIVHKVENKIQFIREIYPYLIAKKKQALLAYNLLLFSLDAKKIGKTIQKDSVNDKRKYLTQLISKLNKQKSIDIPEWCIEPPSMHEQGWFLRQDIIWAKPNPMPESVKDRCTKAHEYIFLLSKSAKYYYDYEAIKEPASYNTNERVARSKIGQKSIPTEWHNGIRPRKMADAGSGIKNNNSFDAALNKIPDTRNKRSVWTVSTKPFPGAHFATFPPDLIEPCILAGSPKDGIVFDPFFGAGTTGIVSLKNGRNYIGIELNPKYAEMAENRIKHGTVEEDELEIIKQENQIDLF